MNDPEKPKRRASDDERPEQAQQEPEPREAESGPEQRGPIEPGLALVIAGQVAAGLLQGEGQPERAQSALFTIGMFLVNASDDERVTAVLELGR